MRKLALFTVIFILIASYIMLAPVYQFYAHRGEAPMPPWGYVTIPADSPSFSQVEDERYTQAAENATDILEAHRQNINSPGISAAVAIEGKLVWAGGAGWADIEADKPVNKQTQFRIGSTSKALTSTLLARLVQKNTLDLDTPLGTFDVGNLNPNWKTITVRQLASHMAGLPHYGDSTEWTGLYRFMTLNTRYEDVLDAVHLFDESELLFAPGEDFSYSSLGTVLLSAVMQESGHAPYQQLMQTEVFTALGMENTYPEPPIGKATADMARFYWRSDESKPIVRPWRDVDLSHRLAGGGFISTPSDLVKLGMGFIDNRFISADVRKQFWTTQTLNNGQENEQNYAIGWRVPTYDYGEGIGDLMIANHGGVSRGSQSWLMVIPQYKIVLAVNSNANTETFWDFGGVSTELARTFIKAQQQSQPK
ncbi:serine hydrolase domain-containing protein [Pseudidiomarina homiensis]|uniref:serine hydrolase domain-containing protein n=1 Tax=Pseudidiomarina homiensis TaxID=364198 RepID=UPI00215AA9C6|nr:beta-lactamase family protein [Pseudidiomarina homiensis]